MKSSLLLKLNCKPILSIISGILSAKRALLYHFFLIPAWVHTYGSGYIQGNHKYSRLAQANQASYVADMYISIYISEVGVGEERFFLLLLIAGFPPAQKKKSLSPACGRESLCITTYVLPNPTGNFLARGSSFVWGCPKIATLLLAAVFYHGQNHQATIPPQT